MVGVSVGAQSIRRASRATFTSTSARISASAGRTLSVALSGSGQFACASLARLAWLARWAVQPGQPGARSPAGTNSPEDLDHVEAHLDRSDCVLLAHVGDPADAVIAVAEDLYPQAMILIRGLVEAPEQLVERLDKQLG